MNTMDCLEPLISLEDLKFMEKRVVQPSLILFDFDESSLNLLWNNNDSVLIIYLINFIYFSSLIILQYTFDMLIIYVINHNEFVSLLYTSSRSDE